MPPDMPAAAPLPASAPGGATMAGWLDLHGVTAAELRPWLDPAPPRRPAPGDDPALPAPVTVGDIAGRLSRALPGLAPLVARTVALVRVDLSPDRDKFPRAFTLHDDGTGRPFLSVPCAGRLSDVLRLAHEMGHAVQIVAAPAQPPPVMRELAACLAEALVVAEARAEGGAMAGALARLHAAEGADIAWRQGRRLRAALDDPAAPYGYGWNYPLARVLAGAVLDRLPAEAALACLAAPPPLADLLARLEAAGPG